MEKLSKIAWYFQRIRATAREEESVKEDDEEIKDVEKFPNLKNVPSTSLSSSSSSHHQQYDNYRKKHLFDILESILLWENSVNSISVVIVFNILFWGIVVLEIRGFAAASSAALVVVLCYSTLESHVEKEKVPPASETMGSLIQSFHIDKVMNKMMSGVEGLKELRRNQPGTFCIAVCSMSLALWLIGRTINGVLLTYTVCMGILLGPGLLLRLPKKVLTSKEWENEMEEFMPLVNEDSIQLLTRAGETGDHSPTPPSGSSDHQIDPFDDDEMIGLKMPSHEDGSTDGLELSDELELNNGELLNETNGLKVQSKHFDGISSSDEEELEIKGNDNVNDDLSASTDDSDDEFEVIDKYDIPSLTPNFDSPDTRSDNLEKAMSVIATIQDMITKKKGT